MLRQHDGDGRLHLRDGRIWRPRASEHGGAIPSQPEPVEPHTSHEPPAERRQRHHAQRSDIILVLIYYVYNAQFHWLWRQIFAMLLTPNGIHVVSGVNNSGRFSLSALLCCWRNNLSSFVDCAPLFSPKQFVQFRWLRYFVVDVTICPVSLTALLCCWRNNLSSFVNCAPLLLT